MSEQWTWEEIINETNRKIAACFDGKPQLVAINKDEFDRLTALVAEQQRRIAELDNERERLKQEAQMWAGEARCHKSTVHEIYQFISGATGEKGNWNGAKPVIEKFSALQSSARQMAEALEPFKKSYEQVLHWREIGQIVPLGEDEFVRAHAALANYRAKGRRG